MDEREPLTDVERQIVDYVRAYRREHGAGPTDGEGARFFGWASGWAFGSRVKKLVEKGHLGRGGGHRSLFVVGEERGRSRRLIDVYCEVLCGPPQPTGDDAPEQIDLDQVFDPNEVFFVKARGTSMIDAQIQAGDFVAIKKDIEWKPGDTVLIRIEGELTLKKIETRIDRTTAESRHWLIPCNKKLKAFPLDPAQHNEIVGVFAGVVRLDNPKKK